MGGYNPAALTPSDQVSQSMATMLGRIRKLEARLTDIPLICAPVSVAGGSVGGTTSATDALIYRFLDNSPLQWSVTISVLVAVSSPGATARLTLNDSGGNFLGSFTVSDQQVYTFTADGATGPFALYGKTSAGQLTVYPETAVASPYAAAV